LSSQVLQTTYISDRYFYLIGVLPSLEREECKKIIESYGGRVTTAVSGKTDYLLAGRDVGKTKTDKADKLRVKIISEDNLLEMIRTRPGNKDAATKSPSTKTSKPTVLKPIENTSFVSISSPKLKVYKQDDGILCKLHREIVFQIFILCKNRG
jgi:BRCT domain type II-containing protein